MNTSKNSEFFSPWQNDAVALIVLGTEKVVMEMGICDGAAPLLWPCSGAQVVASIVKREEY